MVTIAWLHSYRGEPAIVRTNFRKELDRRKEVNVEQRRKLETACIMQHACTYTVPHQSDRERERERERRKRPKKGRNGKCLIILLVRLYKKREE